jgi:MFS family permease
MFFRRQRLRLRSAYREYPRHFWTIVFATFVDRLGGFLIFPFFTLYITRKFGVGMTTVGLLFGIFSVTSILGSTIGGALSDRIGRKAMLLFGLVSSALSMLWMGLVDDLSLFFVGSVIAGLFSHVGGPAQQAMVADLLPEKQRADGFGILRVTVNVSATLGPAIGGLLAAQSYLLLFVSDAITSLSVAVFLLFLLPETRPVWPGDKSQESLAVTFKGYGVPLRDATFMVFLLGSTLMVLVYMQLNSTLAVYLRDVHGVLEQRFGYLVSLNAILVVLLQFPITRSTSSYPPFTILAVASMFYAFGFAMYGFVSEYALFLLAMVIITIGEMLSIPVTQALVARLAPSDMRGRYMAVFGYSWSVPSAVGPLLAGVIMDNTDPRWVWYAAGMVGTAAAALFMNLRRQELRKMEATPAVSDG